MYTTDLKITHANSNFESFYLDVVKMEPIAYEKLYARLLKDKGDLNDNLGLL